MNQLVSAYDLEARLQIEQAQRDGTATETLLEQLRVPRKAVDTFETIAAEIAKDATLSDLGRRQRLDEERTKALASIDAWHVENVSALDAQIASLRTSLAARLAEAPGPSTLEIEMLTSRLAGLDATQRMSAFAGADARTRRALEAASEAAGLLPVVRRDGSIAWEPLVDPEAIARHREARLRNADPETTQKLRTLERRRGVLRALGSRARMLMRDA